MHVMDSVNHFGDMGLFQDGTCPPSGGPAAIGATQSPPTLVPPPPPLAPPPPPPPLPPPLLPPPLLPPPLLPGLGDPSTGLRRNKSVRKLFWKTIPEHQVKGRPNLWTQGPVEQHQIDVRTIEELFGHDGSQSNSKAPPTRGGRGRTSFRETKEEICILDGKRGMNIGIFLKQFKRSNQAIVEDIRRGNGEPYGPEPLRELLKLLPESDEVKKLKVFRGDATKLSLADSFVYLLIQLPSYVTRIESMLLKEEFPAECESMTGDIRTLRSAIKELMCCEELHAVLHLVLQAGNILNAGGYAGNAVGFKLSSLPSLAETKANKPGMNLLHFVALEAQKKGGKLLEFPLKLDHVRAASRISLETLDSDLQRLVSRIHSIEESVQRDEELLQQLDVFLQSAASALVSLRGSRQQLKAESEELLDFFCEDKETFRLDDCFSIFTSFCLRFTAAVKDNAERERKETARRRRLQELEEQKRHSWAAGERFGGVFGLRSSSELDVHNLSRSEEASLLMELLMPKSHPRSPLLRRSGSFRRTRNPTESEIRASELKGERAGEGPEGPPVANEQKMPQNASDVAADHLRGSRAEAAHPTSDLNNNGKEAWRAQRSTDKELKTDLSCKVTEKASSSAVNISIKVEKCTLVPELKAFDKVSVPTKSKTQNMTITDFDEEKLENGDGKVGYSVKTDKDTRDTVMVWCVTGVCEAGDPQSESQTFLAGNSTNQMPLKPQSANQNTVPISSQPQPSLGLAGVAAVTKEMESGAVLTDENGMPKEERANQEGDGEGNASENGARESPESLILAGDENVKLSSNEVEESEHVTHREVGVRKESEETETARGQTERLEKERNGERHDLKMSQKAKLPANPKLETSSKRSTSSKNSSGFKPVRTLTTTESLNMRRVVPILRPNSAKASDKPGSQRGMSSLPLPGRSASRRFERPSTAPSSRRSSFNKAEGQEQDVSRKSAAKKTQDKKKIQQEEKICRTTLRSMGQKEVREVWSAPVTPVHRTAPGFTRNTASSSLRRTTANLEKGLTNKNVPSSQSSANTSPQISHKTSSPKSSPKSLSESPAHRQNSAKSEAASLRNEETSKTTPPKILSPKMSTLRSAKSPLLKSSATGLNVEASSPKASRQTFTGNLNQSVSCKSVQNPTIYISDALSPSEVSLASKCDEDSADLKNENTGVISQEFANESNLNFASDSENESPRKISRYSARLSQNISKTEDSSPNKQTATHSSDSEGCEFVSWERCPKTTPGTESLNYENNNLEIPQNSASSPQMCPVRGLLCTGSQNTANNNPDLPSENSIRTSSPNSAFSGKSTNSQLKIPSPKAAPRSSVSASRLSPNNNQRPAPNASPKLSKSPSLSRHGVQSSPKSPSFGVNRSPGAGALHRSPPRHAPPGVRRGNDSGSFSEKSVQATKDSRPTWR